MSDENKKEETVEPTPEPTEFDQFFAKIRLLYDNIEESKALSSEERFVLDGSTYRMAATFNKIREHMHQIGSNPLAAAEFLEKFSDEVGKK